MYKTKHTLTSLVAGVMVAGTVLTGCSYQSANTAGAGNQSGGGTGANTGVIKVGLDVDAQNLDPRLAKDTTAARVDDLVQDGLVRLDANLAPQPDLAVKWDNPNPTTWVFHLRQGVTFQDGTPFTSADVKYTYDSVLDPTFKAPYAGLYKPIKDVKVIDSNTVEFDLAMPYAPLLSYLTLGIVPKDVGQKSDNSLAEHPVGTGPYQFVSWAKNSKIVLKANPKYWAGAPKTKEIDFDIIPDNTARAAALESGDVNLIQSPLSPQDVSRIQSNNKFVVQKSNGLGITYLNFNLKNSILADSKVRQAIAHLIDKKTISSQIYQSMDTPATSPLIPPSWAYSNNIQDYNYDPQQAKSILEQDGWKLDSGGIFEKNGKKLSITLATHSEDPNRVQTVQFLQNAFAKAGIETKVSVTQFATLSANLLAGKYDVVLLGWLNLVDPDRGTYTQFHTGGGNNWGGYSNPQVDKLLDEGRTTLDQSKRATIYQQAAQLENNDVYYDVLLYQGYVVMYTKNLEGFTENPSGSLYGLINATLQN